MTSLMYILGKFRCYFLKIDVTCFLKNHQLLAWVLIIENFSPYFLDHMISIFESLLVALPQNLNGISNPSRFGVGMGWI